MMPDDDAKPIKAPVTHRVGEPLDTLSVDDLDERVALLKAEIGRLEAAMAGKRASRDAADAVFKR